MASNLHAIVAKEAINAAANPSAKSAAENQGTRAPAARCGSAIWGRELTMRFHRMAWPVVKVANLGCTQTPKHTESLMPHPRSSFPIAGDWPSTQSVCAH